MWGVASRSLVIAALGCSACAAPNLSRTVGRGNGELHVSAGGPLFATLGPTIPVPHANVGGRYGVTDWMDVDGNIDALALAFQIWAMDLAASFQLLRNPGGLAVASSARFYLLGDLDDAPSLRAYPEWGVHLGGPVPGVRWLQLYGGQTMAFSLSPPREGSAVFWTPFVGAEALMPARRPRRGKPRQHGLALHASWTNPWDDRASVLDYRPRYGAMGIYLGYRVRFGGLER